MQSLIHISTFYRKLFGALAIGVIIFFGMSFFFRNMGFDSDCFGIVFYCSKINSFSELIRALFSGLQESYCPLNEIVHYNHGGFFSYYRPLGKLVYVLSYWLFGFNSYGYFLLNVLLHALTAALIYVGFTFVVRDVFAFFLALMFAFHPAMTPSYIGLTCELLPVYLFLSGAAVWYCLYIRSEKGVYYGLSALFFLLSLLSYELPIVFPFIVCFYLFIFERSALVRKSWLLFVTIAVYCALRFIILGGFQGAGGYFSFISLIKHALFNWYQAVKPFWGMQEYGKFLPVLVTGIVAGGICLQFIFDRANRRKLFLYVGSFFLAAWPVFLVTSQGRYFYAAIPFFCLLMFELVQWFASLVPVKWQRFVVLTVLCLLVVGGYQRTYYHLKRRETYTFRRDNAFRELAGRYTHFKDFRIIFLGTLHCYNHEIFLMQSGMTQAARIFFNNPDLLAYHVTEARLYSKEQAKATFDVKPIPGGFRFISSDPENLFIMCRYSWREGDEIAFSMGTIIIHKKYSGWQASDVSFIFDQTWLEPLLLRNTIFLTWNMVNWRFVTLDTAHLTFDIV